MAETPKREPQDVSEVGPTPYKYLFAETIEEHPDFVKEVQEHVEGTK